MDAHRGVVYTQKVVSDESVAREMTALSDRAAQIQNMLGGFHLGGLDLSQFQSGVDRAHASLEALHQFALQPTAVGAPTMAQAAAGTTLPPGIVSHLATYPAATLPPAAVLPPAASQITPPEPETAGPELPTGEFKDLKTDLEKMTAAHKAAEDKLAQQTKQSDEARAAANAAAAKVQAQQEAELTARAAAENEKRAALPDRVVRNRIAMLTRLQKFEADKEAAEAAAAAKQAAQLQKTAEAEKRAADKQAAAAQKAAEKQAAAAQKAAEAAQKAADKQADAAQKAAEKEAAAAAKVAERRKAQLEKQTEADKKYWESFVKFGEESNKKRAEQNERAAAEHERAVQKLEHANIRLRRHLSEALVGATELARGFTELGLVGEEDMEKIKDAIIGVQSAVDLVHGGVGVWNALAEAAQLYHERLVLIKEAEEAAAAVHAATSASGAAAAAGGLASSAGAAGGIGGLVSNLGGMVAAINPVTAGLLALGAAVGYVFYAFHKQDEELKAAAEKDKQARERELSIREQQNQALLQIFAAEKQARAQTEAREATALKVSQEFGDKRGEYEAEAARRGLKGQAAQQSVADQAALNQNRLALEQARKDLAEAQKLPERSRQASTGQGPLAAPKESEAVTAAERERLEEIQRERKQIQARMRASEAQGNTSLTGSLFGLSVQTDYGRDRERMVELSLEEKTLRHQDRPAQGVNQFAADEAAETEAARQQVALRQKIVELEEHGAELSREQFRHEVSALNEELQKQQELVAGDKERLKSAKEYAAQQHQALQSALAGFGQLGTLQQKQLLEIQRKLDRGEKLTQKEEEFGAQHLGSKGKRQIAEQQAARVDDETRKTIFGEELAKDAEAQKQLADAVKENNQHIKQLTDVMGRVAELNARAGGGEKAEVEINATGRAELTVKWDKQSSALIAKAIKPELAKWQTAIDQMLEKAKAEIEASFKRTIQRKAQQEK
jgi:hypothetical protein